MSWTAQPSDVDEKSGGETSSSYDDSAYESEDSFNSDESAGSEIPAASTCSQQHQYTGFHSLQPSPNASPGSFSKLRKFELYSTAQCYYLIASDKARTAFRVLKMDRTLIEQQPEAAASSNSAALAASVPSFPLLYVLPPPPPPPRRPSSPRSHVSASDNASVVSDVPSTATLPHTSLTAATSSAVEDQHSLKPTLRPLTEFCFQDPVLYSAADIQQMLDMIQDGNRHKEPKATTTSTTTGTAHVQARTAGQGQGGGGDSLKPLIKACGIVGFIRFLDCYYLTLITEKVKVGNIGGNHIYTIKDTETFAIKPVDRDGTGVGVLDDPSSMLLNMWNRGKRSLNIGLSNRELAELRYQQLFQVIDMTKDFFFSYTYDLTKSLQENRIPMTQQHYSYTNPTCKDMYCWNFYLTRELENITGIASPWVMPIIHGAFLQRKILYGRSLNLILLARRSRHFAGTRYLKRGVSDRGKVANDVEHEQILQDESSRLGLGTFSSYLQVRGSIPTFWTQVEFIFFQSNANPSWIIVSSLPYYTSSIPYQETSVTMPKPPIVLNRVDPNYTSTQNHFEDLFQRYGSPIVVVDLVKQSERREREVIVGNEFRHAIEYLNSYIEDDHKIRYCALDYSHVSKNRNLNVSSGIYIFHEFTLFLPSLLEMSHPSIIYVALQEVACWAVNLTGFYCSEPRWKLTKKGCIEPMDDCCSSPEQPAHSTFRHDISPMYQMGVMRTNCIE
jgi:hypothetical protein